MWILLADLRQAHAGRVDIADVLGRQALEIRDRGVVIIPESSAAAALEVVSRRSVAVLYRLDTAMTSELALGRTCQRLGGRCDSEILRWNLKASALVGRQYSLVGAAAVTATTAAFKMLTWGKQAGPKWMICRQRRACRRRESLFSIVHSLCRPGGRQR